MNRVALFIPCFNEAKRIDLSSLQKFIEEQDNLIDFYFVDDGSSDNTSEIIRSSLTKAKNCFLIPISSNLGKGNAIRYGIQNIACEHYKYYGFIDADLDIPLHQVLKLYECLENTEASFAISNRGFYNEFQFFRLRSYISLIMVQIANGIIGFRPVIKDTQCGCKMLKADLVDVCFGHKFVSQWLFDIEIFLRLKRHRYNARNLIVEVPLKISKNALKSTSKVLSGHKILYQLYLIKQHYK